MRRLVLVAAAALAAFTSSIASAQTLKVVMHSDVKVLDPIWSGAYITRNYGYMVYDTLFAMDEKYQVKPQMVDSFTTSDDGLTWNAKYVFHDPGRPVGGRACPRTVQLDDKSLCVVFYDVDKTQEGGPAVWFLRIPLANIAAAK